MMESFFQACRRADEGRRRFPPPERKREIDVPESTIDAAKYLAREGDSTRARRWLAGRPEADKRRIRQRAPEFDRLCADRSLPVFLRPSR